MAVNTQLQVRRGTASQWTSTNPTLASGEFGYETDTGKFKIGNGSTAWTSLSYAALIASDIPELSQDAVDQALTAGTGIVKNYNDGSNTLTLSVDTNTIQTRVADVSDTEIGYLNGVTSAIQTQLDSKLATATASSTYAPLASPTFSGTVTLPNNTVTNAMLAGSIANNKLANSTVTINGSAVSLGGSTTIQAGPDEIAVIMGALI